MHLSPIAQRVLGSLVEKRLTTPAQHPLSVAALATACNQRSAREPVMTLDESEVQQGLRELRDHDLARTSPVRGRVPKHEHTLDRQLDLDEAAQTVLGVLLLRGPQTVGEIRTRTDRWHGFDDLAQVEDVLAALAAHPFLPLVAELPREPGRRESRWTHLLADPGATPAPSPTSSGDPTYVPAAGVDTAAGAGAGGGADHRVPAGGVLTARIDELSERVALLEDQLSTLTDQLAPLLEAPS